MIVVPLGIVFGGYQLLWYGWSMLKGPGMGFLDLLLPSRVGHAQAVIEGWWKNTPVALVPVAPGQGSGVNPANRTPNWPTGGSPR